MRLLNWFLVLLKVLLLFTFCCVLFHNYKLTYLGGCSNMISRLGGGWGWSENPLKMYEIIFEQPLNGIGCKR